MEDNDKNSSGGETVNGVFASPASSAGLSAPTTAGSLKERWSEFLFALSAFFGLLHFIGIAGQVGVMFLHSGFGMDVSVPFRSSALMGNIYLAFLAAYVGRKEFVRWFEQRDDAEVVPRYILLKMSRGEVIIIAWAVLTGMTVLLRDMGYVAKVPGTLLTTLTEVVAIWLGTSASKYLKAKITETRREAEKVSSDFGERAIAYARERGSIDNADCQREFGLSKDQAYRLLKGLEKSGKLKGQGVGRARRYVIP